MCADFGPGWRVPKSKGKAGGLLWGCPSAGRAVGTVLRLMPGNHHDTMKTVEKNNAVLKKAIKASATRHRYVNSRTASLGDPLPPSDGAKVKLDLAARNNDNLLAFATQHDQDMTNNAFFP